MVDERPMPEGGLTFDQIAANHGALCIECRACRRRSALTSDDTPQIHVGNKNLVKYARFKCSRHGCRSVDVRLYFAHTLDEAEMFLAGDRMPEGCEV